MSVNPSEASSTPSVPLDVAEHREWLADYEADLFNIACQRCGAPFKNGQHAIAAPAEWFGVIEWTREAADEIERLRKTISVLFEVMPRVTTSFFDDAHEAWADGKTHDWDDAKFKQAISAAIAEAYPV